MAVRDSLKLFQPVGTASLDFYPHDAVEMAEIHQLAGHAYALNPNPRLVIGGSEGSLIPGQPFVDTWWSPGAGTTDVTNFDTAAETPNVFKVTDNYNTIRQVYDTVSLPADTNNTRFPLYANAQGHLQCMTRQDFIDTFVLPVLDQFGGGGQTLAKSGTYYLQTSANPVGGTVIGIAAVNQEANPSAYLASQIPEDPANNNNITNYYLTKVDLDDEALEIFAGPNANGDGYWDLPVYWDSGTETVRHHNSATWAALMNPFLRYYLGGNSAAHTISYNVDGADGVLNGTIFADTAITTAGSTYQTRYVNTDDYRTQEFPTGTAVLQSQKRFKIHQG